MPLEKLMTVNDVAELLGVGKWSVYESARRGENPATVWIGRHLRFNPERLEEWLAAGGTRRESASEVPGSGA